MKFGQFVSSHISKEKINQKILQKLRPENWFQGLLCLQRIKHILYWKKFEAIYLYYIFNSKAIKISPDQHAGLLRFPFTEDSLKIKNGLVLVSSPNFL